MALSPACGAGRQWPAAAGNSGKYYSICNKAFKLDMLNIYNIYSVMMCEEFSGKIQMKMIWEFNY